MINIADADVKPPINIRTCTDSGLNALQLVIPIVSCVPRESDGVVIIIKYGSIYKEQSNERETGATVTINNKILC